MYRVFNINNTWFGFHNNIKEHTNILGKNTFPSRIVDNVVKHYLNKRFVPIETFNTTRQGQISAHHCKLPFIGLFSNNVQRNIRRITIIGKGAFPWSSPKKDLPSRIFRICAFQWKAKSEKRIYNLLNPQNTRCHAIMNEGQETGNNVIR